MNSRDLADYLERIGVARPEAPTPAALGALHEAHLRAVPFENLDIHRGVPIRLELGALHDKIVTRRRGGFCYELNGLFAALLGALGYRATLVSARVVGEGGVRGPPFDHAAIVVALEGPLLVDVGFGDAFARPLRLDGAIQLERGRAHRARRAGAAWVYESRDEASAAWVEQYELDLTPRVLSEFDAQCAVHQTSPSSPFVQRRVISRLTANGRVTLRDRGLIVTEGGVRHEETLPDEAAWEAARARLFG